MIFILPLLVLFVAVWLFMRQAPFGRFPAGERLERIEKSPFYTGKAFANLNPTPSLTEGSTIPGVMREVLFNRKPRKKPAGLLPMQKTDLNRLDPEENVLVWFGHSSYFMQLDGKRFLVDPVLSGTASPLSFTNRSFPGTNLYHPDEIPPIDYLFITHDHWDHLDYFSLKALRPKIGKVVCSLGTGAHLERWGFDPEDLLEREWYESFELEAGFTGFATPARHFSGRSFVRNKALWNSYVLQTPGMRIYIGGDSGYDTHFAEIGAKYGPFDLAMLECGQYDPNWKYIHMTPESVPQAAQDLRAKRFFPVHWGKFQLANHAWDDSILRVVEANKHFGIPLLHPMIGEKVDLKNEQQKFQVWWLGQD